MDQSGIFKLTIEDKRTQNEKMLTDQLARALTHLNLQRVLHNNFRSVQKKSNRKDYLYVCITGSPPLPTQFEGIGIPGETMVIYPQGLQPQYTPQQSQQRIAYATLEKQAESLHQKIKSRRDKKIVFVFHSFGTAVFSTFLRIFYKDYKHRVIGIIAIGFYPIRPDPQFKILIEFAESLTREELNDSVDQLYEKHVEFHKMANLPVIKDKYANTAYLTAFGQGLGVGQLFEYSKRWYPILKCFIYGREDARISEDSMNQTVVFYSQKRTFSKQYEEQVRSILKSGYKMQVENVQERFIYNMEGGKHSIHLQRKFKPVISDIINQYLTVLESLVG